MSSSEPVSSSLLPEFVDKIIRLRGLIDADDLVVVRLANGFVPMSDFPCTKTNVGVQRTEPFRDERSFFASFSPFGLLSETLKRVEMTNHIP
jgi:hypothetical protein